MEEMNKPNYGYCYPRPAVTADNVVFCYDIKDELLKVLLIVRKNEPWKDKPALPGGFLEIKCETNENGLVTTETNETLKECALRELKEETGVSVNWTDEVGTWSTPGRDSRCISISDVYLSLTSQQKPKCGDDASSAQWVPFYQVLNAINNMPEGMRFMAFDHDQIILKAYQHLQQQICFGPVAYELLPKRFSMTQLQKVYEAILGREFDRRNFARKILDADVLDAYPTEGRLIFYQLNHKKYDSFLKKNKISNLIF